MPPVLESQDILERTRLQKGAIHAFVELHIEQGPVLDAAREDIGVVTAIAAPAALRVRFWLCNIILVFGRLYLLTEFT